MTTFRIMSYHINGLLNASGKLTPELSAKVIRAQHVDLVLLQGIGSELGATSLKLLSERVGLNHYGPETEGGCAFLSRFPLHNIQASPLGYGGRCLRADLDWAEERVHLFNVSLSWDLWQRLEQVRVLLSEQILNNPSFPCATIVAGDFGLPLWDLGQLHSARDLKRAPLPLWRANYPARFPLWGRDRIYLRGPIRTLVGEVIRTSVARMASPHLPLVLDVETKETRKILKIKNSARIASKHPDPVCG